MVFNRFTLITITRVLLILASLVALVYLWDKPNRVVTSLFFGIVTLLQTWLLIKFTTKINDDFSNFLITLFESDNIDIELPDKLNHKLSNLNSSLKSIKTEIVQSRVDREAHEQYLKYVLDNLSDGLISFNDDGNVNLYNPKASQLLKMEKLKNIWDLELKYPDLARTLVYLKPGKQKQIEIKVDERLYIFLFKVAEVRVKGEHLKIVTFQDFKNEFEEQELTAWRKLIRILNHEIMNSITPITTLTVAIRRLLDKNKEGNFTGKDLQDLTTNNDVIENRSKGLLEFIEKFRSLTKIPEPEMESHEVKPLFDELATLFSKILDKKSIQLSIDLVPTNLSVIMDSKLINQVLINLIKNSIEALIDSDKPSILIIAEIKGDSKEIRIEDNGCGIPLDHIDQIFIPFFTTKESGSGIGLSLSRQIMKLHNGEIQLNSEVDKGTVVILRFPL